jgi:hemolysin activation/secretion protein
MFFAQTSWAQSAPDAGSLRQQIEQQRELPLPPAVRTPRVTPPPEIKAPVGMTLRPQAFRFIGNELLGAEQLSAAVSDFLGQELDFSGLQRAADAVAGAYREAGWIARVYLPEQDISDGTVTLQVVEARFAGLRAEGDKPQRVSLTHIESFFEARQTKGEPLNSNHLDRALLLADDLPGVSVAGTLVPGEVDGDTGLVIRTTDEPQLYGDVGLDNNGARATGSYRFTANLNVNSPSGNGDFFSLNLLHSLGSDYVRASYTMPAGSDGLRLSVNASTMTYTVIDGINFNPNNPLQGYSDSMGLDLSYPLQRSRLQNLYLTAGVDDRRFYTKDPAQVSSDYGSASVRVGVTGNQFDDLGGGGANSASVHMTRGELKDMRAHTLLNTIAPQYTRINYSVSRQQTLTQDHSLLVSLQGQHATQLLDSSEKFYLGGPQSVRAYPVSELSGERGQLLSTEWRWRLDSDWTLSAFSDIGRVVSISSNAGPESSLWIRGQGLGAIWQGPMGTVTKLLWSRRDGTNPHPTAAGTDGDGTLRLNRLWLTTSIAF